MGKKITFEWTSFEEFVLTDEQIQSYNKLVSQHDSNNFSNLAISGAGLALAGGGLAMANNPKISRRALLKGSMALGVGLTAGRVINPPEAEAFWFLVAAFVAGAATYAAASHYSSRSSRSSSGSYDSMASISRGGDMNGKVLFNPASDKTEKGSAIMKMKDIDSDEFLDERSIDNIYVKPHRQLLGNYRIHVPKSVPVGQKSVEWTTKLNTAIVDQFVVV